MYSLSTAWNSSKHNSGAELVNEIKALGFDTIELNFKLTRPMVDEILSLVRDGAIKVSSLHNICPLPDEISPEKASPDYYSLASLDEEIRKKAVGAAKSTIDHAAMLKAAAVILHAGRVEVKDRTRELAASFADKDKREAVRARMIEERAQKRGGHLASAMQSLRDLVPHAKEAGIALCVENRYYYREIPVIDEFEQIFAGFKPGEVFYWHDVGHAEVFERLGLCRHKDLLQKFAGRLKGVHLHDIIGLINDHNAPGCGTFDFSAVAPYLRPDTLKVIEAHEPATGDEICRGVELLTKILGK